MLTSLSIQEFKCFKSLKVEGLKPLNLIVGLNNSGKTSLLEAVHALVSDDPQDAIHELLIRRGHLVDRTAGYPVALSMFGEEDVELREGYELEIAPLFQGFELGEGAAFTITGEVDQVSKSDSLFDRGEASGAGKRSLSGRILLEEVSLRQPGPPDQRQETVLVKRPAFQLQSAMNSDAGTTLKLRLTPFGGASFPPRAFRGSRGRAGATVRYVPTSAVSPSTLARWWDELRLTPYRQDIVEALKLIDSQTVEIDFESGRGRGPYPKSAIRVRTADDRTLPLSAMGEGMWRLLGLILAVGGRDQRYALVDEIDTGLHHSILDSMWSMVAKIADRRRIQVFATTHSLDCEIGLVRAAIVNPALNEQVAVFRLDPGRETAVRVNPAELGQLIESGSDFRGYRPSARQSNDSSHPQRTGALVTRRST